jgi:rifampicin phosphotransferase
MIFYDLSFKSLSKKNLSNKATGIAWLIDNGYRTPDGIYIHFHKSSYSFKKLKKGLDKLKGSIRKISNNRSFVVRSAHPQEDALTESMAGKFRTIPNIGLEEIISAINEVVVHSFEIFPKYPETGIIIQPQIESKYAGILFTSNPITGLMKEGLISITTGAGAHLVSGQITGNTYYVDDSVKLISGNHEIPKFILNKFPSYIKSLRNKYDYPADLEWVIDNDNQLWFLQIRPITGIGPDKNKLLKIGDQYKNGGDNEKNNIRYFAQRFESLSRMGSLSKYLF